jgi:transposase
MNYNRNSKIRQITEQTLIIGVDIAKHKHVARAQDHRGFDLSKAVVFENSRTGFQTFLNWVHTLMNQHEKRDVIVGMEPTGHYWLNLAYFLQAYDILCVTVNPMHVKRSKELDDNSPTKNDVKDAKVIAQLVKDGRYSIPILPEGIYAELREGMKLYDMVTQDLYAVQAQVHNWLDRYFPEFLTVFKDWTGKAALQLLKLGYLPNEIAKIPCEQLLLEVKKVVKRAVGRKRIEQLKEAAQSSIGLQTGTRMAKEELCYLLEKYEYLIQRLNELEKQLSEMVQTISGAKEMCEIKGIGEMTVVGFFAEVGSLHQYQHPRQIIKLAGLNLKKNESGKHRGKTTISKRGRKRLRALLFRVVMPLSAKNQAFKALHEYYRTRPDNPLTGKQSLVALCSKLIRILFTIGRRQISFSEEKMMQDIPHLKTLQEVA